jgi:hypothetical protein
MQFLTVDEIAKHALADHERGEEISPGVVVERRTILRIGIAAAGLAALGGAGLAGCASRSKDSGTLADTRSIRPARAASADEFVAAVMPQARALIAAPAPDEEAYLAAVTALLARVENPPTWRASPAGKDWSMDTIAYYPPIVLMQIKMAPRSVIHLHDHRHYNGVLLATQGAARCRNFDIVQPDGKRLEIASGEVPGKGEDFYIRQNSDAVLRPRQLSTLTRDRDNIHHVEAGDEGATLVDFFTHFSPKARSYELAWDGKAYDETKGLYKVAWKDE